MSREEYSGVRVELQEVSEDGVFHNRAVRTHTTEEDALLLEDVLSVFQAALKEFGFVTDGRELVLHEVDDFVDCCYDDDDFEPDYSRYDEEATYSADDDIEVGMTTSTD